MALRTISTEKPAELEQTGVHERSLELRAPHLSSSEKGRGVNGGRYDIETSENDSCKTSFGRRGDGRKRPRDFASLANRVSREALTTTTMSNIPWRSHFKTGIALYKDNDYEGAVEAFSKVSLLSSCGQPADEARPSRQ